MNPLEKLQQFLANKYSDINYPKYRDVPGVENFQMKGGVMTPETRKGLERKLGTIKAEKEAQKGPSFLDKMRGLIGNVNMPDVNMPQPNLDKLKEFLTPEQKPFVTPEFSLNIPARSIAMASTVTDEQNEQQYQLPTQYTYPSGVTEDFSSFNQDTLNNAVSALMEAGFPEEEIPNALATMIGENRSYLVSGTPGKAYNPPSENAPESWDWGPLQINDWWHYNAGPNTTLKRLGLTPEDVMDITNAAKAAKSIYDASGWNPWYGAEKYGIWK